jgi:hypothetical protein
MLPEAVNVLQRSRMIRKTTLLEAKDSPIGKKILHHEIFCKIGTAQIGAIVVVRQIGNGNLHFYGIRPARKRNRPPKRSI